MARKDERPKLQDIVALYQMFSPEKEAEQKFLQARIQAMMEGNQIQQKELDFKNRALASTERQSAAELAARNQPKAVPVDPQQKFNALMLALGGEMTPEERESAYVEAFGDSGVLAGRRTVKEAKAITAEQILKAAQGGGQPKGVQPTLANTPFEPGFPDASGGLTSNDQLSYPPFPGMPAIASSEVPPTPMPTPGMAISSVTAQPWDYRAHPNGPPNPAITNIMELIKRSLAKAHSLSPEPRG